MINYSLEVIIMKEETKKNEFLYFNDFKIL